VVYQRRSDKVRQRCCGLVCGNRYRGISQRDPRPLLDRILAMVTPEAGHWIWQGAPDVRTGYGRISVNGKQIAAHRAAWIAVAGPIPRGLEVCHTCDIRLCVCNDDIGTYTLDGIEYSRRGHLFLAPHAANMLDSTTKGRASRPPMHIGTDAPKAVLTEDDIREIRRAWVPVRGRLTALAHRYGVTDGAISAIVYRRSWRHVE